MWYINFVVLRYNATLLRLESISEILFLSKFKFCGNFHFTVTPLTHWDWEVCTFVSKLWHRWFRWWLVPLVAPSQYLNQWWQFVYWTLRNKLQGIFYQNIQENQFTRMSSAKWQPFCISFNVLILAMKTDINPPDARDGIFWLTWSIPFLLMPRFLKSPGHQQEWYWQYRIGNMWGCSIVTWSSSVEQNPRYDMKCDCIFYNL